MSHSNSTQYYNLPQFDSTDKPAWLVDVNPAYSAIDTGIHAAKAAADAAQGDATQALSDASAAGTTASGADAKAAGSIASLADTFDTTATYNVGDIVIYNNLLYICIVDVTVPGAWTGSGNWNRTTIETEINKKQDTINRLTSVSTLNGTDEIAVYDGTNTKKTTAADVASLANLDDLKDVTITSASNGQVLEFDGSKWVNSNCVKLFNITKHYGSGNTIDALTDLISTYGEVNMMFAFDIPLGYFSGVLTFNSGLVGAGYVIQTATGRFWVVSYINGAITLYEKT